MPLRGSAKLAWTQVEYLGQETLRGLQRGGWMNWAAISTVTVLLFLFGISLQTSWQVSGLLQQMGSNVQISLYLIPEADGEVVQGTVGQFPGVANVEIVPKEQAWQGLLADLGAADIEGVTEGLGENPLVDELVVRARSVGAVPQLVSSLARVPGVDSVSYLDEALQHLADLNQGLSRVSWAVVSLLTLTAIAVITTTIRLIVIARHQEIEVMQLVGATHTWIYLPFLLQGLAFGLGGAALAWVFLVATRQFAQHLLTRQPNFLQTLAHGLQLQPGQALLLPIILLTFGSLVGLSGSLLAVRRFSLR
ncbi:ABC transporter permease [Synechococcales cyanobacterium C]|uniref:Cell division protein FtsX n=2 Tax=Petrachloros TaxID=2918834 RepID=A0A8K1ZXW0_9CYAN|nr:ABC transporter permease [Petrachloros mirabilis ULC683]